MIIDQLNTHVLGGAANAARRLHHSLLKAGVDSRFWHGQSSSKTALDNSYSQIQWHRTFSNPLHKLFVRWKYRKLRWQLKRSLFGRPEGLEIFTDPRLPLANPCDLSMLEGDILHLHWVANLFDYKSFFTALPDNRPIVWTLHDMNPFTGGCHYSNDCESFATRCGYCPQLGKQGENDLSRNFFRVKSDAYRNKNIHVVTPSHWLEREARRSLLFARANSIQTIHYGFDTEVFQPRNKLECKQEFGLPKDRIVIGFGAISLKDRRKGFPELEKSIARLQARSHIQFLVFGKDAEELCGSLPTSQVKHVGFIDDPSSLSKVYSATDLFILPSLQDNSPQAGIEAMACGTPVVGFDTGGIPDYVRPGVTGLLAEAGNSEDLAHKIDYLVERPQELIRMGKNARKLILSEFHNEKQANKYLELYHKILTESPSKSTGLQAA